LTDRSVNVRVIYADTDAMGIVYHTNYIKWFEIGRTELLRRCGIVHAEMAPLGFNLPVTRVYCHYLLPAQYDQVLTIFTRIAYIKRASMKFVYEILNSVTAQKMVEGYTVHACTDHRGRVVRLPAVLIERLHSEAASV